MIIRSVRGCLYRLIAALPLLGRPTKPLFAYEVEVDGMRVRMEAPSEAELESLLTRLETRNDDRERREEAAR